MESRRKSQVKELANLYNIRVVAQQGNKFDGMLYQNKNNIGSVGKDEKGFYVNLSHKLTIHETIELLKHLNGLRIDYFQEELEIRYI